jgi:hypothetical protein
MVAANSLLLRQIVVTITTHATTEAPASPSPHAIERHPPRRCCAGVMPQTDSPAKPPTGASPVGSPGSGQQVASLLQTQRTLSLERFPSRRLRVTFSTAGGDTTPLGGASPKLGAWGRCAAAGGLLMMRTAGLRVLHPPRTTCAAVLPLSAARPRARVRVSRAPDRRHGAHHGSHPQPSSRPGRARCSWTCRTRPTSAARSLRCSCTTSRYPGRVTSGGGHPGAPTPIGGHPPPPLLAPPPPPAHAHHRRSTRLRQMAPSTRTRSSSIWAPVSGCACRCLRVSACV